MDFTSEQRAVIDFRGDDLLVSAAAGSGKTAVLVERIFNLITGENAVDVDKLLVVTFTRAAASQMKDRIRARLDKALELMPENENLRRQETLLYNAQITTIDSFCQYIIKDNFTELDIDPRYRVADNGEIALLQEDAYTELMYELFEIQDPSFLHCYEYFDSAVQAGGINSRLKSYIMELYKKAMSMPDPEEWLGKREWKKLDIRALVLEETKNTLEGILSRIHELLIICEENDGPYVYADNIEADRDLFEKALNKVKNSLSPEYEEIKMELNSISFGTLKRISKNDDSVSESKKKAVSEGRQKIKSDLKELIKKYFAYNEEIFELQDKEALKAVDELCDITLSYIKLLEEKKRDKNIITFSDMEHLALKILTEKEIDDDGNIRYVPGRCALSYREHFAEVMIDEYQDSNMIQELILSAVASEKTRFMVGDVKQSIYKFRLADPGIFMEKLYSYEKPGSISAGGSSCGTRIDLHKNFRSRAEILDSTNEIFERIMARDLGGVEYDEDAVLVCGADFPASLEYNNYSTDILLCDEGDDKTVSEARIVASKIRELVSGNSLVFDGNQYRKIRYSDIVILMRATNKYDDIFRRALEELDIPVYLESKTGFFDAVEVQIILNFLDIINNPLNDIAYVSVLSSDIGGFSDEELAMIRIFDISVMELYGRERGGYFSETLESFYEADLSEFDLDEESYILLQKKAGKFLELIKRYKEMSVHQPVHILIQKILDETQFMEYVSALPFGERRSANLDMLTAKAVSYEETSFHGLHRFISYINTLKKYEADEGEANVLDENADVVRIMSIHKSKGLEFPYVFVSGLSRKFNLKDTTGDMILDSDYGPAAAYIDFNRRIKMSTVRKNVVAAKMKADSIGEELRVLYVAMTRAKEKLFLVGSVKNPEKELVETALFSNKKSNGLLPYDKRFNAGSYISLILNALSSHPSFLNMIEKEFGVDVGYLRDEKKEKLFKFEFIRLEDMYLSSVNQNIEQKDRLDTLTKLMSSSEDELRENTLVDMDRVFELKDKFSYSYPHENYKKLFAKTTVTELKEALYDEAQYASLKPFEEREAVFELPDFMKSKGDSKASGALRGTLYHRVMELLSMDYSGNEEDTELARDLDEYPDNGKSPQSAFSLVLNNKNMTLSDREEFIKEFLSAKEKGGYIDREWRNLVNLKDISTFLSNDIAGRIANACERKCLKREAQFMLGIAANEYDGTLPQNEIMLVQGVIDCYFEDEDGRLVLLDYKTDAVKDGSELITKYKSQLELYSRALCRITGKEVKEKLIYSFHLGQLIEL